ncbi:MAG TPA: MFS transporter [Candidatus Limnocylindria bacterium]|nr:MFS transporter [Candidatus Limnocylindria bacterium]
MDVAERPSYRALFAISGFGRLVASMMLARVAQQMVALVLVLLALQRYGSAEVAGIVTFAAVAPGLVAAPIAGALLDRHGRTRLVVLDYALNALALGLIAFLASADALPVPLLVVIVTVSSITSPMSNTGVRTLFPLIVPMPLWERANAVDSNGYVVASIFGPAMAGALVAAVGPASALGIIASIFVAAAIAATGLRDPGARTAGTRLLSDAWQGLVYVVRHPTLRALALSVSTSNVSQGLFFIALPVLVLQRFHAGAEFVGLLFALMGISGFVSVLLVGRVSSRGRERLFLAGSMLGMAAAFAVVLLGAASPLVVAIGMLGVGIANGPFDVALFTVRQRRTDPAWMGRAFAVSMALNFAGFPLGSALGGAIVPASIEAALVIAVIVNVVAAAMTVLWLPRED